MPSALSQRLAAGPEEVGPAAGDGTARCSMCAVLTQLDADTRADVEAALVDPNWTYQEVRQVLASEGHDVALSSPKRHRRLHMER